MVNATCLLLLLPGSQDAHMVSVEGQHVTSPMGILHGNGEEQKKVQVLPPTGDSQQKRVKPEQSTQFYF